MVGSLVPFGALLCICTISLCLAGTVAWLWPSRLDVGQDGVLMKWLFWRRFVAFANVASAHVDDSRRPSRAVLALRDGRTAYFTAAPHEDKYAMRGRMDLAIANRIVDAWNASSRDGQDATLLLERGSRSVPEWVRSLRNLAEPAGYREPVVTREEAWRVVSDPTAKDEVRVGAAVALASHGDEERARLRVTAEGCANPRLRVALEELAMSEEEEDWARALESMAARRA
jgi:hypothetical protein